MSRSIELETLLRASTIVHYDTEFTSWEGASERGWDQAGEHKEIVQIGAVSLNSMMQETAHFSILIKPTINPVLSNYFINLTDITNEDIAQHATDLATALSRFNEFCANAEYITAFGHDARVIESNCTLVGIENPLPMNKFRNVRPALCSAAGAPEAGAQSATFPAFLGLPMAGKHHDALSDTRAITSVISFFYDQNIMSATDASRGTIP